MYVCSVVSKQMATSMKAIWDSDLIKIYNLQGVEGPEHSTKTNWVLLNYRDGQDLRM